MANVLIVDDSKTVRARIKSFLVKNEHTVVDEVSNGKDAILSKHPEANIIMVSGEGQEDTILKAMSLGAKHFIIKPMEYIQLKRAIDSVLWSSYNA